MLGRKLISFELGDVLLQSVRFISPTPPSPSPPSTQKQSESIAEKKNRFKVLSSPLDAHCFCSIVIAVTVFSLLSLRLCFRCCRCRCYRFHISFAVSSTLAVITFQWNHFIYMCVCARLNVYGVLQCNITHVCMCVCVCGCAPFCYLFFIFLCSLLTLSTASQHLFKLVINNNKLNEKKIWNWLFIPVH